MNFYDWKHQLEQNKITGWTMLLDWQRERGWGIAEYRKQQKEIEFQSQCVRLLEDGLADILRYRHEPTPYSIDRLLEMQGQALQLLNKIEMMRKAHYWNIPPTERG